MANYSWTCPYCRQVATITPDNNVNAQEHFFHNNNKSGGIVGLRTYVTVCPNSKCREFTMTAALYKTVHGPTIDGKAILFWNLKPQSSAKPFPDYIPAPIRHDYEEACLICNLSPKASASLARRCLQGIIRDFWGIAKARLIDEINALEGKIDATTWKAIDAVRSIGNIGAHMEKDINLIVDVDPGEADVLLRLIEVLLEEWYIRRHEREDTCRRSLQRRKQKRLPKIHDPVSVL
jgi:hypothetical protein